MMQQAALTISPSLLTWALYVLIAIVIVASISFIYHWRRYGTHLKLVARITTGYLVITTGLLILAALLLKKTLM